ncbi:MAG: LamG-like jellyroll fold domain-containing protein [Limisphaerales bacterium]
MNTPRSMTVHRMVSTWMIGVCCSLWLLSPILAKAQPGWLTDGLVAYLPFDRSVDNQSANQLIVEAFHIRPIANRFHVLGAAMHFDEGLGSAVVIREASPDGGSLPSAGANRSFSLWYRMDEGLPREPWRPISLVYSGKQDFLTDQGGRSLSIGFTSYGGFKVDFSSPQSGAGGYFGAVDAALFEPMWSHLVVVVETNTVTTFHNGRQIAWQEMPDPNLQINTAEGDFWIGGFFDMASFQGALDDIRIYDRALSESEVLQLHAYESQQPENLFLTSGLVAYYPFSGDATDHSLNQNDLSGTLEPGLDLNGNLLAGKFSRIENILQSTLSPNPFNDRFSVSMWAQWESPSSVRQNVIEIESQRIAQAGAVALGRNGAGFPPDQAGELGFHADYWLSANQVNRQANFGPDSDQLVPDLTWTHLTVVRGETWQLFVNGLPAYESDYFPLSPDFSSGRITIGGSASLTDASEALAEATLDEIRIYNRALTSNEVAALYAYETRPRRAEAKAEVVDGLVTRVIITDPGNGYSTTPAIILTGGGGQGAEALAVIQNGIITSIEITNPGSGYTYLPRVRIADAARDNWLQIRYTRVAVTLGMTLGRVYQLESSANMVDWLPAGNPFVAEEETLEQEFVIEETGRYFRLHEIP